MKIKKTNNFIIYIFFFFYLSLGLYTLKDYGVNIEEHTQFYSGIYWLNYIFEFFGINNLEIEVKKLLDQVSLDKQLPDPSKYTYGPVYDVPIAFVEVLLSKNNQSLSYDQRHFFIFLLFFISSFCFYKILEKRFENFFICFFGLIIFIFSPRIYGDSFHNNKDIIFLSLTVISIYFAFKIFEKKKIKNILLFSFFSALMTSTRIMGIFIPFSAILFIFLNDLNNKKSSKYIFLIILFYFLFLILHWPFLWEAPIQNFINFIKSSKDWIFSYYVLYNGKYFLTTSLPDSYIFTWIGITTPILNLVLFMIGFCFIFFRIFSRFILIDKVKINNCDFWRSKKEMKDYFIFFNLVSIVSILVTLNVSLVSGWRHLYFLNIFIVYLAMNFINLILLKNNNNIIKILLLLLLIPNLMKVIEYHPYQSLYFNELLSSKKKNNFLVDREGLSRLESINKILKIDNKKKINVANASFVPYYRIANLLSEENKKRINFVGTKYDKADYIFNNFVYEINPKFDDKYEIPKNFKMIYRLNIDGIKIYEIFKRI